MHHVKQGVLAIWNLQEIQSTPLQHPFILKASV